MMFKVGSDIVLIGDLDVMRNCKVLSEAFRAVEFYWHESAPACAAGFDCRINPEMIIHQRAGLFMIIDAMCDSMASAVLIMEPTCGSWVS